MLRALIMIVAAGETVNTSLR